MHEMRQRLFDLTYCYLDAVGKQLGVKASIWSIDIPEDWHAVAFTGFRTLRIEEGDTTTSVRMANPTWASLWRACDVLIEASGDFHYFIEGFSDDGNVVEVSLGR